MIPPQSIKTLQTLWRSDTLSLINVLPNYTRAEYSVQQW